MEVVDRKRKPKPKTTEQQQKAGKKGPKDIEINIADEALIEVDETR